MPVCDDALQDPRQGRNGMGDSMTIAQILDALYDGIGSTWDSKYSFVDEVAAWVEETRGGPDGDDEEER